ncbi:BTAD domain-containing putative transcriptional regulator [Streptomyces sirii]|uniref:AfsR/SARP family transcriptional regulator n=1 Tax=Streptomyces sirii TaxID=3127701 RepID=UPI003D361D46
MADRQGRGSEQTVRGDADDPDELEVAEEPSGHDPADGLRFQVLGPVRAWRGDRPLELGPPQQRAMLGMLLLHAGRPVSVPQLVDALWGERPPPRAVGTLRTYASRLRGLLEPERKPRQHARLLESCGGGYALRVPAEALDAAAFEERLVTARRLREAGDTAGAYEQLRSALALPEGVALAGLPGPYAQRQRDRLTELCVTAREELYDCVLKSGGHTGPVSGSISDSIAGLRAFAAEHPLRERAQALLMLALRRAGRKAEALEVYAATRRTLDAELGTEPGRELRYLYTELRAGSGSRGSAPGPRTGPGAGPAGDRSRPDRAPDRGRAGDGRDGRNPWPRPPRPTWGTSRIGAPPPVPAQLPPDIADFVGRAETVAYLASALRGAAGGRAPVVATLNGLGGVGKTALAVHVAQSVRAHFPDGQLYVDLQGTGPAPADSGAVLTHFLRALGVAESAVPDGVEQKAALYRSLIADRGILVLLDNARDCAQVRPLLPGAPACAVLVTTRGRTLALPGAHRVDVEVMQEEDALGLLGATVGAERMAAEPDAARELVAACGGLPLAVRIAAARLASRPGRTMADLVARLTDERRLDELRVGDLAVEAAFRADYEALGPDLAHAFRALALCGPPTFCRGAAAAVLDTTEEEAEAAVEALVDAGLVELCGDDHYRYHDLVGLFARRLGERQDSSGEREAAQHRLLDRLLATVQSAVRLIRPHGVPPDQPCRPDSSGRTLADADTAREWLHLAHPRLYAAVERALDAAPGLLGSALDLLTAWSYALGGTTRHRDVEPLVHRAVDNARRYGEDEAAARALLLLQARRPAPMRRRKPGRCGASRRRRSRIRPRSGPGRRDGGSRPPRRRPEARTGVPAARPGPRGRQAPYGAVRTSGSAPASALAHADPGPAPPVDCPGEHVDFTGTGRDHRRPRFRREGKAAGTQHGRHRRGVPAATGRRRGGLGTGGAERAAAVSRGRGHGGGGIRAPAHVGRRGRSHAHRHTRRAGRAPRDPRCGRGAAHSGAVHRTPL